MNHLDTCGGRWVVAVIARRTQRHTHLHARVLALGIKGPVGEHEQESDGGDEVGVVEVLPVGLQRRGQGAKRCSSQAGGAAEEGAEAGKGGAEAGRGRRRSRQRNERKQAKEHTGKQAQERAEAAPHTHTCADAGWCSATESTSGFPVRVCLMKSERTRTERGPK